MSRWSVHDVRRATHEEHRDDEHGPEHQDQDDGGDQVLPRRRDVEPGHPQVNGVAAEPSGDHVVGDEQRDDAESDEPAPPGGLSDAGHVAVRAEDPRSADQPDIHAALLGQPPKDGDKWYRHPP